MTYELCPYCEGAATGCAWCDDSGCPGYVEHDCEQEEVMHP